MSTSPGSVTELLHAWGRGRTSALEQLIPLVYGELRRMAHRYLVRERQGTLQTAALVNEAYLRLVDINRIRWQDRAHFFAISARIMRRILVDHARARRSKKRGCGADRMTLDASRVADGSWRPDLVTLDDALHMLAAVDERQSRIVELRFFGGLSVKETAEVLKISPGTVLRDWRLAKGWLVHELKGRAHGHA